MTQPIHITVAALQSLTRKLCDRSLGSSVVVARSGALNLVITDVVSIPSTGQLIFEVAQIQDVRVLEGSITDALGDGIIKFPEQSAPEEPKAS